MKVLVFWTKNDNEVLARVGKNYYYFQSAALSVKALPAAEVVIVCN